MVGTMIFGGMDSIRANAMWKCMVLPSTMLEDVCQIFFYHTSFGSYLYDLGYQRLVVDLIATCEGAKHFYHPPQDEENAKVQDVGT